MVMGCCLGVGGLKTRTTQRGAFTLVGLAMPKTRRVASVAQQAHLLGASGWATCFQTAQTRLSTSVEIRFVLDETNFLCTYQGLCSFFVFPSLCFCLFVLSHCCVPRPLSSGTDQNFKIAMKQSMFISATMSQMSITLAGKDFARRLYSDLHTTSARHRNHKSNNLEEFEGLTEAIQIIEHACSWSSDGRSDKETTSRMGWLGVPLAYLVWPSVNTDNDRLIGATSRYRSRCGTFASENGLMLLSICAWSSAFRRACILDDDLEWVEFCQLIGINARSIELFAKVRGLRWSVLIDDYDTNVVRETMHVPFDHPHHWFIGLDGTVQQPFWKGCLQRHIDEVIFKPAAWSCTGGRDPTLRNSFNYGSCTLCGSLSTCRCSLPSTNEPLVELVECPGTGIGIRVLSPIAGGAIVGQFVGELLSFSDDNTDEVYSLIQYSGHSRVALISPQFYGNWTRHINHSCDSSCEFVSMVVGQRIVMAVRAKRTVEMFEEITVDYGDAYWQGKSGSICLCGSASCRFGPVSRRRDFQR